MSSEADRPAGKGVLFAACVSALVVNANTSAVTILLPSISKDVDAPIATLQWAVTGYSLVGAAVIVTSGALGDVLGRRKVFLGGLALFIASCVLIALSTTGAGVVAGRMIQGAAGSTILACGMSLLSVSASGAGQMKAITIWGAASAAGGAAGPLVGGVLDGLTGWQGLFWIDAAIANNHQDAGDSASVSLAAGLGGASLALAIFCACGILIAALGVRQHRLEVRTRPVDLAAAAAASHHTIPVPPAKVSEPVAA